MADDSGPVWTGVYYEDLVIGQTFLSGTHQLDEAQIVAFGREFDPQPFHCDPSRAGQTFFGGLVASGWHTAAVTMRLLLQSGLEIAGGMIGAGAEVTWPRPTRPGSVLQVETVVQEMRLLRSRSDRGLVTVRAETRTQTGEVVQILVARILMPRKPIP